MRLLTTVGFVAVRTGHVKTMRQPRILDRLAADSRLDDLGDALRGAVHNVLRPGMV
jgi:hypothetical protein